MKANSSNNRINRTKDNDTTHGPNNSNNYYKYNYQTVACGEADHVLDFRSENLSQNPVIIWETHTNKPLVWVVPNLLTRDEYNCVLGQLHPPPVISAGTNNVTASGDDDTATPSITPPAPPPPLLFGKDIPHKLCVMDWDGDAERLSTALWPRLQHEFQQHHTYNIGIDNSGNNCNAKGDSDNGKHHQNQLHSVHPNWRVIQLTDDEEFPAHQDGMDQAHDTIKHSSGNFAVSTHSVLLEFAAFAATPTPKSGEDIDDKAVGDDDDGATRFYYRQYPFDDPYDYCVDVLLPPGWAIIMEQRADLWYALQPYSSQQRLPRCRRYVAQTGLLQQIPKGKTVESMRHNGGRGTFGLGPGLTEFLEAEAEESRWCCDDAAAPSGWGQQSYNPKCTLWHKGRPLLYAHLPTTSKVSNVTTGAHYYQTRKKALPGLVNERRWSMVHPPKPTLPQTESVRDIVRRRNSLQLLEQPNPPLAIKLYCAYGGAGRNGGNGSSTGNNADDASVTSRTAEDFSESCRSLEEDHDEPFGIVRLSSVGTKNPVQDPPPPPQKQEPQRRGRSSIRVSRKPRSGSMLDRLVKVYQ